MNDISQMVRSANPVPSDRSLNDDELDALLLLVDTRSEDMDTKERLTPVRPPKPHRAPWLVAAAVFVAVLVIGAAALLTLSGGEETGPAEPSPTTLAPTPTTVTPETTVATTAPPTTESVVEAAVPSVDLNAAMAAVTTHVEGFVDAVNTGVAGSDIASRYFPSEAELGCGPVVDELACDEPALWGAPFAHPFLDEWLDHLIAVETVYEMGDCRSTDDHGTVACELKSTSPYEPHYPGHRLEEFRLRFDGDRIDFVDLDGVSDLEWRLAHVEFKDWLSINHPDVHDSTYTAAGSNGWPQPKITSGSAVYSQNLIQYVPLWRAATEGQ